MSWNPKSQNVSYFEPGCICCAGCGWRPDDQWDTSPEGFTFVAYPSPEYPNSGQWECDECREAAETSEDV